MLKALNPKEVSKNADLVLDFNLDQTATLQGNSRSAVIRQLLVEALQSRHQQGNP